MVFGVADDGDADAEAGGDGAFRDGIGGIVGAFGVDVGAQFFQQFFHVWFRENHDVVHGAESGDEEGACLFIEDGAPGAFEPVDAGIGIDSDDEKIAFGFRAG